MSVQRIAARYAKSLIDLAQEQHKLERIREDIEAFQEITKNRDFKMLLKSPIIHPAKKQEVVNAVLKGRFDEMTQAFMRILISKGREMYLPEVAAEFLHQYKHIKGITEVKVTTAVPLSEELLVQVRRRLTQEGLTEQQVELQPRIDPDIIGGFILEFNGNLYDASVATKLDELKKSFTGNLYISQVEAR